jgi:hypothetical protein
MILLSVLAMDKIQVDTYGWLQMEPTTILQRLLHHSAWSKPTAMRILGFVNHSASQKPPPTTSNKWESNDIPDRRVVAPAPLKPLSTVSWPTYLLNMMYSQIKFILWRIQVKMVAGFIGSYIMLARHSQL